MQWKGGGAGWGGVVAGGGQSNIRSSEEKRAENWNAKDQATYTYIHAHRH